MAELKTKKNRKSVTKFLDAVEHPERRADAWQVLELMQKITGEKPAMWGDSMVGFGAYKYKYKSGHQGEWFLTGFSPRKTNLTLYLMCDLTKYQELLDKLGKYKSGKGCMYIKRLQDVDMKVLRRLVMQSVADLQSDQKRNETGCG